MSLPAEPPPPPLHPHREHETLIQYNLRNKAAGREVTATGKCQKRDWKQEHRGQCVKLQQVFVPPLLGWRDAAAAAAGGGVGGGGKAAAAAVDVDDDELENPCPICLDNEDDATVDGNDFGMCTACGQFYCGTCVAEGFAYRSPNCPTCRAPFRVSNEENYKRYWKLVHDRSPGRHTSVAQNNLGFMYYTGKGVEQDHVEAVKWFRLSAEAGNAGAQYNLGCRYNKGEGVEQDDVAAAKWFRKAAEAGHAMAQNNLGSLYDNGEGVEQDDVAAAKWFRKSAEAGEASAQCNLGVAYLHGKGVEQDHVEAVKWYRKSAAAGDAMAQCHLGAMYGKGEIVEQDIAKMLKWFQLAAVQGNESALEGLYFMQQGNVIPTPPPGTAVTTILLNSVNAAKYNNRTGRVVEPAEGAAIKLGRVAVLLDGEVAPISFKLMNLQTHLISVDGGRR
eukprot:gene21129-biopygen25357